jgi:hypothetical protein
MPTIRSSYPDVTGHQPVVIRPYWADLLREPMGNDGETCERVALGTRARGVGRF